MHEHNYSDETLDLLKRCLFIFRQNTRELCDIYENAKIDWNSTTRQDIAQQLSTMLDNLMSLENFFQHMEEE